MGYIRLHLKDVRKGWFNLDEVMYGIVHTADQIEYTHATTL